MVDTGPTEVWRHTFKAMNTTIEYVLGATKDYDAREVLDDVTGWFHDAERRFSRFLHDSELSSLNRSAGKLCLISHAMLEVLELAESYRTATDGTFSPFVEEALRMSGYNKSFELLDSDPAARSAGVSTALKREAGLSLDPSMRSVRMPAWARLDLGGIVKGWAVKRISGWLRRTKRVPYGLINAGGDLAVWGYAGSGIEPWRIGIENPWEPHRDIGVLSLGEGAVATSSKLGRHWLTAQGPMHHLIDPVTMRPSINDVVQCTVTGSDLVECEIWAKTICILGTEKGLPLFERKTEGCEALVFTEREQWICTGNPNIWGLESNLPSGR